MRTLTTDTFDDKRARTYRKGVLVVALPNSEPTIYPKGGWSEGKGYDAHTRIDDDTIAKLRAVLTEAGYGGCQIMPGAHFSVSDGDGNVYGCEPGGFEQSEGKEPNLDQPLAYERALTQSSIDKACAQLGFSNNLISFQVAAIRLALGAVSIKPATIRAYQLTEDDGPVSVITEHNGKVESQVTAQVGDWVVKQANGEVMRIDPAKFEKLKFLQVR